MVEPTGSEETDPRAEADLVHLRRCADLATAAVDAGDQPFGSVLVAAAGEVLAEERNRVGAGGRLAELDVAPSPVRAPHVVVEPTLAAHVRALHARFHAARPAGG